MNETSSSMSVDDTPDTHGAENAISEDSNALKSIVQGHMSMETFFGTYWQNEPKLFKSTSSSSKYESSGEVGNGSVDDTGTASSIVGDGSWNDDAMRESPVREMVRQGPHLINKLLKQAEIEERSSRREFDGAAADHQIPLIFQEKSLLDRDEVLDVYGSSLFGPYLNGCSVVLNHADLLSPWIAALCEDLQKTFPHAYANCYLTPPNSQAVPPHADDRDVLIIQVVGAKDWQVYKSVPVPHPYPHEQVGKDGMHVPSTVLEGPVAISTTLRAGDVLYMPRGFVHQARCTDSASFHVTVALATHDWSLAGIMSSSIQSILTSVVDYRKSIVPVRNNGASKVQLQAEVEDAIRYVQECVTADKVMKDLNSRLEKHNRRAFPLRMKLIHRARFPVEDTSQKRNGNDATTTAIPTADSVVGQDAADKVTYTSIIRAATTEERNIIKSNPRQPRGLNVREEIGDTIVAIISKLKSDPKLHCQVLDLRKIVTETNTSVCDMTLLCLAKRGVELGAMAVVKH